MARDAVITGIGATCSLGRIIKNIYRGFKSGKNSYKLSPDLGNTPFADLALGLVTEPLAPECEESKLRKFMSRDSELVFSACADALKDSGLDIKVYNPYRIGLFVGSGLASGEMNDILPILKNSIDKNNRFSMKLLGQKGIKSINPIQTFKILNNMPLCLISIGFGIKGPNLILNPWEGQAAQAIIEGIEAIRNNEVDCALVGGGDTKVSLLSLIFLNKAGLLTGKMTPGEGGSFLVLESEEKARRRKARIYARIKGWGTATDNQAGWRYSRNSEPVYDSINQAMKMSKITPDKTTGIYSGFDGNTAGDKAEHSVIKNMFKAKTVDSAKHPKMSAGNTFAAAPALSIGLASYSIKERQARQNILVNATGIGSIRASFILETV